MLISKFIEICQDMQAEHGNYQITTIEGDEPRLILDFLEEDTFVIH